MTMCKPFKEYLGMACEYTREFFIFGGIALLYFVYSDYSTFDEYEVCPSRIHAPPGSAQKRGSMTARLVRVQARNTLPHMPAQVG